MNASRIIHRCRAVIAAALLAFCPAGVAQIAHVTLHSEPGDFIGRGQDWDLTYTPASTPIFLPSVQRVLPTGEPTYAQFLFGNLSLVFSTDALGMPLAPGLFLDAQRAPFAAPGHPGLQVSFMGNGCSSLTGNFTIQEFNYTTGDPAFPNGIRVDSFRATFEQHCEGQPPALFGTFTYFHVVPEPSAWLLALGAIPALIFYRRLKH